MGRISGKDLFLFLVVAIFIAITQFKIFAPHLDYGFQPDDVYLLAEYEKSGSNPLQVIPTLWKNWGPHGTSAVLYMGVLYAFLGLNYLGYQITILIFKILAILSFYLMIRIVFKNLLLAAASAIVFSIHFASMGSMEMVTRSQDYPAIVGINLFLIIYLKLLTGKLQGWKWQIAGMVTLLIPFALNAIRVYPLIFFVVLVELFYVVVSRSLKTVLLSIKRVSVFFAPFIAVFLYSPQTIYGQFTINFPTIAEGILNGNLQLLITPITSLGSLFLTGNYYRYFGVVTDWSSFSEYVKFILDGPLIIFGLLTLVLALAVSQKPIRFFLQTLILNIIGELILFKMINNRLSIPLFSRMHYDPATFAPPAVLGIYFLVLVYFLAKEWKIQKFGNRPLLLAFTGIIFTFIFWFGTWLFADFVTIPTGINGWATIPSMGASAAISGLFVLVYCGLQKKKIFRIFASSIFLAVIPFFFMSNSEMQQKMNYERASGMLADDQVIIRQRVFSFLDPAIKKGATLILVDWRGDVLYGGLYSITLTAIPKDWLLVYGRRQAFEDVCNTPVWIINQTETLGKFAAAKEGEKGFLYSDNCGKKRFYKTDDFYAFRLLDKQLLDIKNDLINNLQFGQI